MVLGFVLISAAADRGLDVYDRVRRLPGVRELHPLFGEYDLIAKLEATDADALGALVADGIRSIDGVADTKTLTEVRP